MLDRIRQLLRPPVFENEEKTRVAGVLNIILLTIIAVAPLVTLVSSGVTLITGGTPSTSLTPYIITGVLFMLYLLLKSGQVRLISVTLSFVLLVISTAVLNGFETFQSATVVAYVVPIVTAGLLMGRRAALSFAVLSVLALASVTYTDINGNLITPPTSAVTQLFTYGAIFMVTAVLLEMAGRSLADALARVQRNERAQAEANRELRALQSSLEEGVANRTRDLALAAEVSRSISQIRDLNTLLANAVELIRLRFDLYYAQIYLVDPGGRALALHAGTGDVGLELMRRAHRLPIVSGSINGRAAAEKRTVVVADTAASGFFKPNPLLPDTRSEMAVPLIVGDHVVGVLDLQGDKPNGLSSEQLPAFEVLAGQLAVAIDNARLFAEAEQARAEVERQASRLTREGWQAFLDAVNRSERLGYTFDHQALTPLTEPLLAGAGASILNVPVSVAGELIGRIQLERDASGDEAWTENDAELVTAIATRVANQIENLRLLAQAEQYRVEAEAMTRRLTREGWDNFLQSRAEPVAGYTYDSIQVTPLSTSHNDDEALTLSLPLQIQNELVGQVAIAGVERLDPAVEKMAAMIVQQLSTHIENLRLSEQVQARAHREQILSDITARVHNAVDADAIMRTAVQEISRALGRPAFIYLGNGDRARPSTPESVPVGGAAPNGDQPDEHIRELSA